MSFDRQFRGLWSITCDACQRTFETNGTWDATPSKSNTIALARSYGWRVGKDKHLCKSCKLSHPRPPTPAAAEERE